MTSSSSLVARNVVVAGSRTSMRLEPEFWDALQTIARAEGVTLSALVTRFGKGAAAGRTGSVRVFVLRWFRTRQGTDRPTQIARGVPVSPGP